MHKVTDYEEEMLRKLIRFGENEDSIRAMLLTSSLCNPNAASDVVSDFDVELFFNDPMPFVESDAWLDSVGFGPVMAIWHWPNQWDHEPGSGRSWMRMVYYHDGSKFDFSLAYLDNLRSVGQTSTLPASYDIGYKVLLDKDGLATLLDPPTYGGYLAKPPTADQFRSRVEMFWMNSTYVARYLWREDVIAAKWRLHELFDRSLREVLEWSVAMKHDWKWRPGKLGRGLLEALDPDTRTEVIASFAAGDLDDLWRSLFRTTTLYRNTAIKVAEALGLDYPDDLDTRVTAYHGAIRRLDRQTGTREELAQMLAQAFGSISPGE